MEEKKEPFEEYIEVQAANLVDEISSKIHLAELEELLVEDKEIERFVMFGGNQILDAINKIKNRECVD
ncbi:MAG: hypothetical protein ACTSO9_03790 [Candidatus Helarchaeota archaeon]